MDQLEFLTVGIILTSTDRPRTLRNVHGMLAFWAAPGASSPGWSSFSTVWQSTRRPMRQSVFDVATAFPTHGVHPLFGGLAQAAGLFGPPVEHAAYAYDRTVALATHSPPHPTCPTAPRSSAGSRRSFRGRERAVSFDAAGDRVVDVGLTFSMSNWVTPATGGFPRSVVVYTSSVANAAQYVAPIVWKGGTNATPADLYVPPGAQCTADDYAHQTFECAAMVRLVVYNWTNSTVRRTRASPWRVAGTAHTASGPATRHPQSPALTRSRADPRRRARSTARSCRARASSSASTCRRTRRRSSCCRGVLPLAALPAAAPAALHLRRHPYVSRAQPIFLVLMPIGGILCNTAVYFLAGFPDDTTCILALAALTIGFTLLFAACCSRPSASGASSTTPPSSPSSSPTSR